MHAGPWAYQVPRGALPLAPGQRRQPPYACCGDRRFRLTPQPVAPPSAWLDAHIDEVDTIVDNTGPVRQQAEDKIYSALGRVRRLKEQKPGLTIGVLGCMAQKDQGKILRRAPHVDLVVGPGQLGRVSEMLA